MGRRLRQLDPRQPSLAITVAMATFHTSLLVLIVILVAYFSGAFRAESERSSPLAGLALFAYVWVFVWIAAAGALRRLEWPHFQTDRVMEAAAIWGGFAGVALYGIPAVPGLLVIALSGIVSLDLVAMVAAFFVLVLAGLFLVPLVFAGGVFLGMLFGLLDMLLFAASRVGAESPVLEPARRETVGD
jgi:hypothetical protein